MWEEIEKEFLGDNTGRSKAFFDTVLDLTDYYQQTATRNKEEMNLEADKNEWLRRVKENSQLSDEEREKLEKYIINSIDNLGGGNQKMTDEKNEEIPTVDEIINEATKKPTLTLKSGFSPHDLRDVAWEDVRRMTAQNQFRFDEIVKAQKPKTTFNGVVEKLYEPELLFEEPGIARVERKPGGFELTELKAGGKRDIYRTPEQALRAVSALKKEERLREKEEKLANYEELSNVEERLAKEEDSILGRELREKIKEAKARMLKKEEEKISPQAQDWISNKIRYLIGEEGKDPAQAKAIAYSLSRQRGMKVPEKKEELSKATFPSVGRGTRQRPDAPIGEAGVDRKAPPMRLA